MAETETQQRPEELYPALLSLAEQTARAKLRKELAEAEQAALKAKLPSLDVEVEHDTVVVSDKTTGLARVCVQLDSLTIANDLADRALDAARAATDASASKAKSSRRKYTFRIVSDPSVFKDIDAYRLLSLQLTRLSSALDEHAPAKPDGERKGVLPIAAVGAIAGVGIQAVGLVSKLLAREYTLSGTQVTIDDLGFDLELANALKAPGKRAPDEDEPTIEVDRVMPTPTSTILKQIQKLAVDADKRLNPKLATAEAKLQDATAGLEDARAAIKAINEQMLEVLKHLPDTAKATSPVMKTLSELRSERASLEATLSTHRQSVADAKREHESGAALQSDIETFIATALTPTAMSRPPALQAARAEPLLKRAKESDSFILYSRLLAGGVDQEIERKVGDDKYLVIAGATAEFALLSADGQTLLASTALSLMEASTMTLMEPHTFSRSQIGYAQYDRVNKGG